MDDDGQKPKRKGMPGWEHHQRRAEEKEEKNTSDGDGSRTKATRMKKKNHVLVDKVMESQDFDRKAEAIDFIFDKAEKEVAEEIEAPEEIFGGEVHDLAEKYLCPKKRLLTAKFINILDNCDGKTGFVVDMFNQIQEEIPGAGSVEDEWEDEAREEAREKMEGVR